VLFNTKFQFSLQNETRNFFSKRENLKECVVNAVLFCLFRFEGFTSACLQEQIRIERRWLFLGGYNMIFAFLSKEKREKRSKYENLFNETKQTAENGNVEMMYRLSFFYENGIGVKQDFQKAFDWYKTANDKANKF
jgi:hypothetical protein